MDPYVYTATVVSVYDGDTITCTVRCGFGVNSSNRRFVFTDLIAPKSEEIPVSRD